MIVARRRAEVAILTVMGLVLATLAALYSGISQAKVNLNDGGVWVTNSQLRMVAHLSYPSRTLDGGLRAPSAAFDVSQRATDVVVHDQEKSQAALVDPARLALGDQATYGSGAVVLQGGETVAAVHAGQGKVWAVPTTNLPSLSLTGMEPVLTGVEGARAAVGVDGAVHVVSALTDGSVRIAPGTFETEVTELDGVDRATEVQVSAVGPDLVWLDRTAGVLHLPGGRTAEIPEADLAQLQQPGPTASFAAVATPSSLLKVTLADGRVDVVPADPKSRDTAGVAIQPVQLNGCVYGAWTGTGNFVRRCATEADSTSQANVPQLAGSSRTVFRVNRDVVVLNDTDNGNVWLVDRDMQLISDWQQITSQVENQEQQEDEQQNQNVEKKAADRTLENKPPNVQDDAFGARPGRSTLLPVLLNDEDPDGDILTVEATSQPSFGRVVPVRDTQALQLVDVPEGATGSTSFTYTANDGRGGTASGTVTVTVRPPSLNEKPRQVYQGTVVVESGGSARYATLGEWLDPDGDAIFLDGAVPAPGSQVQTRRDGVLEIQDLGTGGVGPRTMEVIVSDGQETGTATLNLDVRPAGDLPPTANADHVRVIVGQSAQLRPLANDTDPNGDRLRIAGNPESTDAGVSATTDSAGEAVTVQAQTAGSSYLTYTVTDGPNTTTGLIRVDALDRQEAAVPVPEDDLAFLPAEGEVLVDVLGNDFDPAGGVLVTTGVTVPDGSGLTVEVVRHNMIRITAPGGLAQQTTFRYDVSNGVTAAGQVTVIPLPAVSTELSPDAVDDAAIVRAGDVVTVHVLDNDTSPAGLDLTVDPELPQGATPEQGEAFVSEDTLRFKASDQPGTVRLAYTVRDDQGHFDSAQVQIDVLPLPAEPAASTPPVPQALTARAIQGNTVLIPVPLDGIDPDGDSVQLVGLDRAPTQGTVTPKATWLEYAAPTSFAGTDVFEYAVEDRFGRRAAATVRVGVAPPSTLNQKPVAVTDEVLARPGRQIAVPVLANDIDPDGDQVLLVDGSVTTEETGLDVGVRGDRVTLTTPRQPGRLHLTYGIEDGRSGTATGTITIEVREDAPLLPPVARDDAVGLADIDGVQLVEVPVLDNDEDPDGDSSLLTVGVATAGVSAAGGVLSVPVTKDRQVIVYTVTDEDDLSAKAVVVVPGSSEQRPMLQTAGLPLKVKAGQPLTIRLGDHVKVRKGHRPTLTTEDKVAAAAGWNGQPLVKSPDTLEFTSDERFGGMTSVSFEVTDGKDSTDPDGTVAVLTLPIEVEGIHNDPPVFTPSKVDVALGEPAVTVDLAAMVKDPTPTDRPKIEIGAAPAGFVVSERGTQLEVAPAEGAARGQTGVLKVTVDDGFNDPVTGDLPLAITASTRPLMTTTEAVIDDARAGRTSTVDLTSYITNPFSAEGKPVTFAQEPGSDQGGTVAVRGLNVDVTPPQGFDGTMNLTYTVQDATGDAQRRVQGRIRVTVKDRPDRPTAVRVDSVVSRQAVVSWTAGANNGAEITNFTVRASGGPSTSCGQTTTCTITGLTNNQTYTFTVVATNEVGDSDPSDPSGQARPDAKPDQPNPPQATRGDRMVTVTWTKPRTDGSDITGYDVDISPRPAGVTQPVPVSGGDTLTYEWKGLTNGTPYTFTVRARSSADDPSEWSLSSAAATPVGKPQPPTNVRATVKETEGLGRRVEVVWTTDASTANGGTIQQFTVTSVSTGQTFSPNGPVNRWEGPLAESDTELRFTVNARNEVDVSLESGPSDPVRIANAPGPVGQLTVRATGNDEEAVAGFTPPDLHGAKAAEVTYYWQANGGAAQTVPSDMRLKGNGLTDGTNVNVEVWAVSRVPINGAITELAGQRTTVQVNTYGPPSPASVSCSGSYQVVNCSRSGGSGNGRPITYSPAESSWSIGAGFGETKPGCVTVTQVANLDEPKHPSVEACTNGQSWDAPATSWYDDGPYSGSNCSPNCRYAGLQLDRYRPNSQVRCTLQGVGLRNWSATVGVDGNGYYRGRPSGGPSIGPQVYSSPTYGPGGTCVQQ